MEYVVRAGSLQRHDTNEGVRVEPLRYRSIGSLGVSVRGAQAEQEAAGLENLLSILNFHNLGAGSPSRHDTRRVRNSSLALPERMHNHCAVAYLALASQHTLVMLGQRVC